VKIIGIFSKQIVSAHITHYTCAAVYANAGSEAEMPADSSGQSRFVGIAKALCLAFESCSNIVITWTIYVKNIQDFRDFNLTPFQHELIGFFCRKSGQISLREPHQIITPFKITLHFHLVVRAAQPFVQDTSGAKIFSNEDVLAKGRQPGFERFTADLASLNEKPTTAKFVFEYPTGPSSSSSPSTQEGQRTKSRTDITGTIATKLSRMQLDPSTKHLSKLRSI
jgi:hypothetical protein